MKSWGLTRVTVVATLIILLVAACAGPSAAPTQAPAPKAETAKGEAPKAAEPASAPKSAESTKPAAPKPAADVIGVTNDSIKIGSFMALSGPLAAVGKTLRAGAQSYFNMINEKGGINGRKIDYIIEDHQYDPAKATAAIKKLVEQDKVFMLGVIHGSPTALAVLPYIEQNKVPTFGVAGNAAALTNPPRRYLFHPEQSDLNSAKIIADYAMRELKATKIAVVYENNPFGKDGLEGIKQQLKKKNLEVVAAETYDLSATDYSSQVLKLKQANPDVVILYSNLQPSGRIVQEMQRQSFKPKVIGHVTLAEPTFLELAGSAAEGVMMASDLPQMDSPKPEMDEFRSAVAKYFPEIKPGYVTLYGWSHAKMLGGILQKFGRDLDREKLVDFIEATKDYTDGIHAPITFGPSNRMGSDAKFFVQVKNGKFTQITDWWKLEN